MNEIVDKLALVIKLVLTKDIVFLHVNSQCIPLKLAGGLTAKTHIIYFITLWILILFSLLQRVNLLQNDNKMFDELALCYRGRNTCLTCPHLTVKELIQGCPLNL